MTTTCTTTLSEAVLAPGFCAYALPNLAVGGARTVLAIGTNDFWALERHTHSIVYGLYNKNTIKGVMSVPTTYMHTRGQAPSKNQKK